MDGPTAPRDRPGSAQGPGLPGDPRIVVIGTSSAGKSTLAQALGAALHLPRIDLDELFWSPGWQPKPPQDFLRLVEAAAAGERWVADGNYSAVRPVLWPRATLVVWLNYPLRVVFWRGLRRALRRIVTGETLWHGNRESFRRTFLSRDSILLWILTTHAGKARQFGRLREDPRYAGKTWLEFRRPAEADAWLRKLRQSSARNDGGASPG